MEDKKKLDDIKLFIRLPSWLKVEPPIGTYNPDRAIVKQPEGEDAKLYLVRQTKSTKDQLKLRGSEWAMIQCGKAHFDALDVDFKHVTSASEVQEKGRWLIDYLTTSTVEDIHHLVNKGQLVADVVSGLRGATLPGIMEYGCLRWALRDDSLPPLPQSIIDSPLGAALASVASELGIESDVQPRQPTRSVDVRPVEFFLLDGEEQLTGETWDLFQIRFNRSAQSIGLSKSIADSLQAAMHEMAENAIIHACSPIPTLAGYRVMRGLAQFCVADVGIGVLQSLKKCADCQHLQLHIEAIQEALRDGVSRYGRNHGGLGFRSVFKALAANWGHLRFRSCSGCISMDGSCLRSDHGVVQFPLFLPGFQVSVSCKTGDHTNLELFV